MESKDCSTVNKEHFDIGDNQHASSCEGLAFPVNEENSSFEGIAPASSEINEISDIHGIDSQSGKEILGEPKFEVDSAGPNHDNLFAEQSTCNASCMKENRENLKQVSSESCNLDNLVDCQRETNPVDDSTCKQKITCSTFDDVYEHGEGHFVAKKVKTMRTKLARKTSGTDRISVKSATVDKNMNPQTQTNRNQVNESNDLDSACNCPVSRGKTYICGACAKKFKTICELHQHFKFHGSRGSYHYDELTLTAFPKFDSVCVSSQTKNDPESVVVAKPVLKALISTANVRKRKQSPIKISVKEKKAKAKQPELQIVKEPKKRGRKPKIKPDNEITCEEGKVRCLPRQVKTMNKSKTKPNEVQLNAAFENKDVTDKINAKIYECNMSENSSTVDNDAKVANQIKTASDEPKQTVAVTEINEVAHKDETSKSSSDELCDNIEEEVNTDLSDDKMEDTLKNEVKLLKEYIGRNLKTRGKKKKGTRVVQKSNSESGNLYMSCEVCNTVVLQKKYKEHLVCHSDKKLFICEVCGMGYAKKNNLSRHMLSHSDVKPFQCKLCPSQFIRKMDYECHVNSHKGYRAHLCKVCDKSFLTSKGLKAHQENIHMGFTKFQCRHCDRRFFKRSGLNTHEATHYEATLKCQYCDHKFRDKCGLRKHERTHTGLKHYQCHVCNNAFNQCTPYYVHMEKRHNINRESIKQVMKIVMEAYKRVGKKLEFYRVPCNIEEIMANLLSEEKIKLEQGANGIGVSSSDHSKTLSLSRISPSTIANVISGGKSDNGVSNIISNRSRILENSNEVNLSGFTLVDLNQKYDLRVCVNKGIESKSYDDHHVAMSVTEEFSPMNSSSSAQNLMLKEESGASLLDLDKQPKTWISTDGNTLIVSGELLGYQESVTLAQNTEESLRSRQYTSTQLKPKMKILSQHAEFSMQRPHGLAVTDQVHEVKQGMSSHLSSPPVHSQAVQQMDPMIEAYTADFLEKIFQSQ
ncbi:uncharacterized protein LOC127860257 [Dreissena polymorpha]|uniref:C2H2-type domain-containing protein n=1 Tax=Dreissena polymorpha TaxID=45954 RepID=A0A9D3YPV5_DREPO|nr:uncharacterized protein LOC127860257 [Dreissena polymorpha]XP_052254154.1 uncharacterized protein LOC127860257 [Dreissena polymorpha]XP_052254155.1 uncharacterized protein LOC127860257 [Dreissena polymorpha]XP_052254156.1 uncharacterized protein LOC127860257 [Dreissena polymorpha]XP_052254157.1 uncharacterized protein LOC127860257 [Dreissena polymorpha]XP_052254158.1 uncharacterized protein LOC127860257 [Dreissena polymorpha]KAH3704842.1 hypothetical protein DPMN_079903 [Dreissena polymorp